MRDLFWYAVTALALLGAVAWSIAGIVALALLIAGVL